MLGDLADPVVLGRSRPTLNACVVHQLAVGARHRDERLRDVLDVHERAPRHAVALHQDLADRKREPGEVVDDEVAAQPGREP